MGTLFNTEEPLPDVIGIEAKDIFSPSKISKLCIEDDEIITLYFEELAQSVVYTFTTSQGDSGRLYADPLTGEVIRTQLNPKKI